MQSSRELFTSVLKFIDGGSRALQSVAAPASPVTHARVVRDLARLILPDTPESCLHIDSMGLFLLLRVLR
jgi:hypothetical protein